MTEQDILRSIRLAVNKLGRLFRNNTGVLKDANGRPVRFGLTKGSSDLIGWTEVIPGVAVFTAVEVKKPKKKPTKEQQRFIDVVRESGGMAGVATSDAEAVELIERESERIKKKMADYFGNA